MSDPISHHHCLMSHWSLPTVPETGTPILETLHVEMCIIFPLPYEDKGKHFDLSNIPKRHRVLIYLPACVWCKASATGSTSIRRPLDDCSSELSETISDKASEAPSLASGVY